MKSPAVKKKVYMIHCRDNKYMNNKKYVLVTLNKKRALTKMKTSEFEMDEYILN